MNRKNTLKVGDKCPSFSLNNQKGEKIDISNIIGSKNILIYFYPKDETYGCTQQACSFRDAYDEFLEYDCEVFGISSDDKKSHDNFSIKHNLNFDILSDFNNEVRNMFGVPRSLFGLVSGRVTYLVDKKGEIVWVFNSQIKAKKHIEEALNFLKK